MAWQNSGSQPVVYAPKPLKGSADGQGASPNVSYSIVSPLTRALDILFTIFRCDYSHQEDRGKFPRAIGNLRLWIQ